MLESSLRALFLLQAVCFLSKLSPWTLVLLTYFYAACSFSCKLHFMPRALPAASFNFMSRAFLAPSFTLCCMRLRASCYVTYAPSCELHFMSHALSVASFTLCRTLSSCILLCFEPNKWGSLRAALYHLSIPHLPSSFLSTHCPCVCGDTRLGAWSPNIQWDVEPTAYATIAFAILKSLVHAITYYHRYFFLWYIKPSHMSSFWQMWFPFEACLHLEKWFASLHYVCHLCFKASGLVGQGFMHCRMPSWIFWESGIISRTLEFLICFNDFYGILSYYQWSSS